MKDKMKDLGKMIQDKKPGGTDVKCAEIKALPVACEKQKNVFKIGEYNKATASFEMNSGDEGKAKTRFDLSADGPPCHYFKSSFARSVVVSNRSRSLDYGFANKNGCPSEENEPQPLADGFWLPGKENWDLRRARPAEVRDDESCTGSFVSEQPSSIKKSEIIEEHLRNQSYLVDRPVSRSSTYQKYLSNSGERRFEDSLLRSPLTASCRSSFHRSYSSASDVDSVMLQSQVTTLQWQLRQAEASRQMYRAVMEQVVSFLQKTHKNLDILQNRLDDDVETVTRVPRSRSVHAVDTSPTRFPDPRSDSTLSFHKAKSFAQIGDPDCPKHGAMFRETSWRRARKQQAEEEVNPSKLSEEAFRLLRTVKSLLSTREPDLASRLSASCSSPANIADVSSASSTVSAALDSDNSDHFNSKETLRRTPVKDSAPEASPGPQNPRRRRLNGEMDPKTSPPQLSISSADDESGFSSLNSFQEIGVPVSNFGHQVKPTYGTQDPKPKNYFQEVGLPKVEEPGCRVHRRWSSTPADGHLPKSRPPSLCTNGDVIRVLWV